MALVKPDLSEAVDEITAGVYRGIVKRGEVKYWDEAQTKPYVHWIIETFGEVDAKNNGRMIHHKTSASGKGIFTLQQFYRAATGKVLAGQFDTEECVGKPVELTIVDGVRDGVPTGYVEVKKVRAAATPGADVPRF